MEKLLNSNLESSVEIVSEDIMNKVKELKDMFEKQNLQSLQSLKFQIKPSKITLEDGEESKTPKVVGE